MIEIISQQGDPELATVFVARFRGSNDLLAEFVDARDPDVPAHEKWVIIVSTQFGCPVACPMCDAGGDFRGNLTADEIFAQIDAVVARHPQNRLSEAAKFKIQFARMGEPSLNPAVIDALTQLPNRYKTQGLIPCVATIAPASARGWFERLLEIRNGVYAGKDFQLQLSINSTDDKTRDRLMPCPKFTLAELGEYASRFHILGSRKVALNFAITREARIDPDVIARWFDPNSCCIKLTPLNPTMRSREMNLSTALPPESPDSANRLCNEFMQRGFDVILSIGDVRENEIGSNCGMAVRRIAECRSSPLMK